MYQILYSDLKENSLKILTLKKIEIIKLIKYISDFFFQMSGFYRIKEFSLEKIVWELIITQSKFNLKTIGHINVVYVLSLNV